MSIETNISNDGRKTGKNLYNRSRNSESLPEMNSVSKKTSRAKRWLILLFFSGLTLSCASNIGYQVNETLDRPVGLQVYARPGGLFVISYYVQNDEDTFDGYNLYISRESTGDTNKIPPYTINGSIPTFLHTSANYDPNTAVNVSISEFMDVRVDLNGNKTTNYVPFETGTRYYFKIKAHSRFNFLSQPSNEASAVTLP